MTVGIFNSLNANATTPLPANQGGTGQSNLSGPAVVTVNNSGVFGTSSGTTNSLLTGASSGSVSFSSQAFPVFSASSASSSITGAISTGYVLTGGSLQTLTLPITFAAGNMIAIQGQGAGLWKLGAGASRTIVYLGSTTSSGGSLSAASRYDNILVVGIVANSTWAVFSSSSSGLVVA